MFAPCCSEYGYCHARDDWAAEFVRDCNTVSNGQPLPLGVLQREYIERLAAGNTLLGLDGGCKMNWGMAFTMFICRLTTLEDMSMSMCFILGNISCTLIVCSEFIVCPR